MESITFLMALSFLIGTIISAFATRMVNWTAIYICLIVMSICSVAWNIGHKNKEEK